VTATAGTGTTPEPTPEPSSHSLVHQHQWRLVAVDYDDLFEVRELHCQVCGTTRYE
jgi:hypothetical protein